MAGYENVEGRLLNALRALRVMERHSRLRNEQDAYLFNWCRYGLGERDAPPRPEDFGMPEEPEDE